MTALNPAARTTMKALVFLLALVMSATAAPRPKIYQMLPRLFGNTNATRKTNGTLAENGCGTFADINDPASGRLMVVPATGGPTEMACVLMAPEAGVIWPRCSSESRSTCKVSNFACRLGKATARVFSASICISPVPGAPTWNRPCACSLMNG